MIDNELDDTKSDKPWTMEELYARASRYEDQEELRVEFNMLSDAMFCSPAYKGCSVESLFETAQRFVELRREFWTNYVKEQNDAQ